MTIAPCHVTWWENLHRPDAAAVDTLESWDALFGKFERRMMFLGAELHPGWSPIECDPPKRGLENVRRVFALCLDYDGGTTIAEALERWAGFYGFVHTSRRHADEEPRFRVILPLARPVSPFEFGALWRRVAPIAGNVDQAPKDPSRFWFAPGAPVGAPYVTHRLDGDPLNPDEWLARPEPAAPAPLATRAPANATDAERRALAYIARMPAAIAGSGGHQATWDVAVVLARGFALSESDTLAILRTHYNPRCEPQWSEKELEHKARNAAASERLPLGYLLTDSREDDPHRRVEMPAEAFGDRPVAKRPKESAAPDTRSAADRHGLVSMQALMQAVYEELQRGRPKPGISTGSEDLDVAIGGFRPGHVTVFGAKRGWGKTSYGNLVVSRAVPDYRVLMFAGEDAASIYGRRFLAMRANLNAMALRDNRCDPSELGRIVTAIGTAPDNPFFTRVEGRPVEWIAEVIRDVAKEGPLDLVIVDYLQCIRTGKKLQDRRNEVTYVTATLSQAIKSVNAAGILFSQLKRTERSEPEVEDLKESGDIEDMADHILLGWKDETRSGSTVRVDRKIKLGKNKDGVEAGEVSEVLMRWNSRNAAFEFTPSGDTGGTYSAGPPRSSRYEPPPDFDDDDFDDQPRRYQ